MNIEQLRADMEAGTQGDWDIHNGMSSRPLEVAGCYFAHFSNYSDSPPHRAANARRIARVPQLERIALAAEALAKIVDDSCIPNAEMDEDTYLIDTLTKALAAYREATQ